MAATKYATVATNDLTFALDASSGDDRMVLVRVTLDHTAACTVTGVTYAGAALSLAVAAEHIYAGSRVVRVEYWYTLTPATGSNNVVVSLSATPGNAGIVATTYTACGGLGTNSNTTGGNISDISMTITTDAASSTLDGCWHGQSERAVTPAEGVTLIDRLGVGADTWQTWAGDMAATGGSDTWTITLASAVRSAGAVVEVLEAAGGATTHEGAAALTGAGSLAGSGQRILQATALLSGSAAVSAAGTVQGAAVEGAASLAAAASVSASGQRVLAGAVSLSGAGAFAGSAQRLVQGAVTLSGAGFVAAAAQRILSGAASLAGAAAVAAVGEIQGAITGAASLAGSATLAAAGQRIQSGAASLAGTATVSAVGVAGNIVTAAATLTGSATLAAAGQRLLSGAATMSATGALAAAGQSLLSGVANLSGAGTLVAAGRAIYSGAVSLPGVAAITAVGTAAITSVTGRVSARFGALQPSAGGGPASDSDAGFSVKQPGATFGVLD